MNNATKQHQPVEALRGTDAEAQASVHLTSFTIHSCRRDGWRSTPAASAVCPGSASMTSRPSARTSSGSVPLVSRARNEGNGLQRLTERQQEVLALMAEGLSNAAIARALYISAKSVVHHASKIYEQLGLPPSDDDHRRVLAVIRYLTR